MIRECMICKAHMGYKCHRCGSELSPDYQVCRNPMCRDYLMPNQEVLGGVAHGYCPACLGAAKKELPA